MMWIEYLLYWKLIRPAELCSNKIKLNLENRTTPNQPCWKGRRPWALTNPEAWRTSDKIIVVIFRTDKWQVYAQPPIARLPASSPRTKSPEFSKTVLHFVKIAMCNRQCNHGNSSFVLEVYWILSISCFLRVLRKYLLPFKVLMFSSLLLWKEIKTGSRRS